jgi:hypothetical protein
MVSAGALLNGPLFSFAGGVGAACGSGTEHVLLLLLRGLEDLVDVLERFLEENEMTNLE